MPVEGARVKIAPRAGDERLYLTTSCGIGTAPRMESALVDQASEQFLGQWRHLVSTTNWEKGQIVHNWRRALRESGVPATEYADEAWSRRVGNITAQHVGRLRRAYERFGGIRDDYPGLYWSHFQAALDWDDAEMWL